jgi:zinc protease
MVSLMANIFPYNYDIDDLRNGLRLITVPTDYPNLVALYIVVRAGSRNEVEPGKSGFAHLFEHLMFRGTDRFSSEQYDEILKNAGADHNAYTADDRTVYHITFSSEDLEEMMVLEADRFQNLKVPIDLFKTETRAVLGEYNKSASNPMTRLLEVTRDTAFTTHTYKHTTMGFIRDIENMPNLYDYSLEFFDRYYRPQNTTIIVTGDARRQSVLPIVNDYWGDWERGNYTAEVPAEPRQSAERKAQVDWPTPTLPWVMVAYKGPPFSDRQKDMPAMDLISQLGFSEGSELYQRLVVQEQKVDTLTPMFEDHQDPFLVMVAARVKNPSDLEYVRDRITEAFEAYRKSKVTSARLEAVKSHMKYGFALSLDNSQAIAEALAPYAALTGEPESINRVFDTYARIDAGDIQGIANKYFDASRRTIVTLSHPE